MRAFPRMKQAMVAQHPSKYIQHSRNIDICRANGI